MLYFGTVVTAFGVAVQPALPPLVRTWVPQRIGFATAATGFGWIGEILPGGAIHGAAALHQSWQWDFAFWRRSLIAASSLRSPRAPAVTPTAAAGAMRTRNP